MKTEKERLMFSARVAGIDFAEAEVKITALLIAQRDRFEHAFAAESGSEVASLERWRTKGPELGYRADAWFLCGAWHGWKLKERFTGDDPFMGFIFEGANAGELAAYDYGCNGMMGALEDVLNSMERGGVCNQPWEGLKARVYELKEKAARYDWLVAQKGLDLRAIEGNGTWFRLNGTPFHPTHMLAAGGVQFSPTESLDATIDGARAAQNARQIK